MDARSGSVRRLGVFAGAVLTTLFVGHDVVFLLAYGPSYRGVLARTGHDPRWETAVLTVVLAAALLALVGLARITWLARLAQQLDPAGNARKLDVTPVPRLLLKEWARFFAVSTLLFTAQENYERASTGLALPGVGVLGGTDGASPVLVFALVSLLVAIVSVLFRWTIGSLEERLARARRPSTDHVSVHVARPSLGFSTPASSVLGRNLAGRAPPTLLPC